MKKIYKRILSLGLAVGVIFSLQESTVYKGLHRVTV